MNKLQIRKEELEKEIDDLNKELLTIYPNKYSPRFSWKIECCQAELKGINLGLEALSQRDNLLIVEHYKKYGVIEGDRLLLETSMNNFKKGRESKDKEILEKIENWFKEETDLFYEMEFEQRWNKLKQQLTTEGEGVSDFTHNLVNPEEGEGKK